MIRRGRGILAYALIFRAISSAPQISCSDHRPAFMTPIPGSPGCFYEKLQTFRPLSRILASRRRGHASSVHKCLAAVHYEGGPPFSDFVRRFGVEGCVEVVESSEAGMGLMLRATRNVVPGDVVLSIPRQAAIEASDAKPCAKPTHAHFESFSSCDPSMAIQSASTLQAIFKSSSRTIMLMKRFGIPVSHGRS